MEFALSGESISVSFAREGAEQGETRVSWVRWDERAKKTMGDMSGDHEHEYFENLVSFLLSCHVGVVFVALGSPKQEYFIHLLREKFNPIVYGSSAKKTIYNTQFPMNPMIFMSVGGSFDELSGRIPRAPGWASRLKLKWAWRLIVEPWRWKRQLALVEFVWLVCKRAFLSRPPAGRDMV